MKSAGLSTKCAKVTRFSVCTSTFVTAVSKIRKDLLETASNTSLGTCRGVRLVL